jgi:hypothetical protein
VTLYTTRDVVFKNSLREIIRKGEGGSKEEEKEKGRRMEGGGRRKGGRVERGEQTEEQD